MAILDILHYPDKRLRTVATDVDKVDDSVRQLIDDMFETMYDAPGIGLAATQVDVHKRIIVIDVSEDKSEPLVLINPEVIEKDGVRATFSRKNRNVLRQRFGNSSRCIGSEF